MPSILRTNGFSSPRQSIGTGRPARPGSSRVRRFSSWLNRNRRLVVALLLCAAAGIAVQQLTPAPAHTVTALASARDLAAGTALSGNEVVPVKVPPGMVPSGAVADVSAIQGKQLAAPVRKGQLISDTQILGPGLLAGAKPGSAAVPLRMADPSSIQLVAPGQLVNIVMTNGTDFGKTAESEVLAASVPVLWTSGQGGQTGQWLGTGETEGLIVVAADPDQARRLAGSSTQGKLFFVLVGSQG
ncbi:Flp pilus assembly protein CpaB [Arthrobacter sp. PvP023]|uniref:Flp pilus assembly protein CpaB n=1 Tax=Micrococcaceae TaxID=1268 RepID=UPI001B4D5DCB|nr:RcpC/CpaB family pilus assembly protein [Arthrobacter sp. PvP023]MBP1135446.1 Flp pilus assembly protein CpaB [Arthrobacter sp. PvP023]